MPILAVLDETAYGSLDDPLKTLYKQNTENKNYYLDISPDEAGKVAFNLQTQFENKKTELTKKHTELNEIKAKFAPFEALGKNAEEIVAAIEAKQPEDIAKLISDHKAELLRVETSYKDPMQKATETADRLRGQVASSMQSSEINRIVAANNLDPETAPAILRDFIRAVPKAEGSDEFVTQVFDGGVPALVAGQPINPDALITGWREAGKYKGIFIAGTGGGSDASARQFAGGNGKFTMSRSQVKSNIRAYETMQQEAAKVGQEVTLTDG